MAAITTHHVAGTAKFADLRKRIETTFEFLSIMVIPALFISSVIISLEILPGVATFVFAGVALGAIIGNGAQAVMMVSIEAAMVGCSVVAKRAKVQGDRATENKYNAFGYGFFGLFVLTLGFFAFHVPSSWDLGLTLFRCICAGLYAFVCHGDNHEPPTLTVQQVNHLDALNETVNHLSEHLALVQSELPQRVQQGFTGLVQSELLEGVHSLVRSLLSEHLALVQSELPQLVGVNQSEPALKGVVERLHEVSTTVREMSTTITDVRSFQQNMGVQVVHSASPLKPIQVVHSGSSPATSELASELASEPVNHLSELARSRVHRFITEQVNRGHTPSLSEIVNTCKCSKGTAIRYRRELLDDETVEVASPGEVM